MSSLINSNSEELRYRMTNGKSNGVDYNNFENKNEKTMTNKIGPIKKSASSANSTGSETTSNGIKKRFSFDTPVHISQDSLLSGTSGYTNYRGLFNLAVILLVLSNARVALENLIKYGILIDFGSWFHHVFKGAHQSPIVLLFILMNLFILIALIIEKLLYYGRIISSNRIGALLHGLNLTAILTVPVYVILLKEPNPLGAAFCLSLYTVIFLKLISYAHFNYWCRTDRLEKLGKSKSDTTTIDEHPQKRKAESTTNFLQRREHDHEVDGDSTRFQSRLRSFSAVANSVVYPANLTVKNIYYFMLTPTLCYELNFPRSAKIRKWFVIKRLLESFFLMNVIFALCQQWIVPLLKNSLEPFIAMNYSRMLERLLKLAIPNHIIWLLFFYWQFHSVLNLVAELLRFADREFYRDWWNSETIDYFWRNWNIPVHRWCVRHLYKPMIRAGYNRLVASTAVFFVSAFFHEYLISVPLHLFRLWAFTGMFAQVPLNMITSRWAKGRAGNVVVWLSLIVGQPLCILMYVHDWYVTHHVPNAVTGTE